MERMCGFHSIDEYADKALLSPECLMIPTVHDHYSDQSPLFSSDDNGRNISSFKSERESGSSSFPCSGNISESVQRVEEEDEETCKAIKTQIASHPSFPKLLDAYKNCQNVGAPPEITSLLDEIKQKSGVCRRDGTIDTTCLGDDLQLDDFMVNDTL